MHIGVSNLYIFKEMDIIFIIEAGHLLFRNDHWPSPIDENTLFHTAIAILLLLLFCQISEGDESL